MKTLRKLMFGCLALMVALSMMFVSCSDDDDDDDDPVPIASGDIAITSPTDAASASMASEFKNPQGSGVIGVHDVTVRGGDINTTVTGVTKKDGGSNLISMSFVNDKLSVAIYGLPAKDTTATATFEVQGVQATGKTLTTKAKIIITVTNASDDDKQKGTVEVALTAAEVSDAGGDTVVAPTGLSDVADTIATFSDADKTLIFKNDAASGSVAEITFASSTAGAVIGAKIDTTDLAADYGASGSANEFAKIDANGKVTVKEGFTGTLSIVVTAKKEGMTDSAAYTLTVSKATADEVAAPTVTVATSVASGVGTLDKGAKTLVFVSDATSATVATINFESTTEGATFEAIMTKTGGAEVDVPADYVVGATDGTASVKLTTAGVLSIKGDFTGTITVKAKKGDNESADGYTLAVSKAAPTVAPLTGTPDGTLNAAIGTFNNGAKTLEFVNGVSTEAIITFATTTKDVTYSAKIDGTPLGDDYGSSGTPNEKAKFDAATGELTVKGGVVSNPATATITITATLDSDTSVKTEYELTVSEAAS